MSNGTSSSPDHTGMPLAYPATATIIEPAAATYPVWDDSVVGLSRYLVSPKIAFAFIVEHPVGHWRWRCGCNGADGSCSGKYSGYWYDLASAKAYVEEHMQNQHFIAPP